MCGEGHVGATAFVKTKESVLCFHYVSSKDRTPVLQAWWQALLPTESSCQPCA